MSPAGGVGGGDIDTGIIDSAVGWIVGIGGLIALLLREGWARAHQGKTRALEEKTRRIEKTTATVAQFEKLATEIRKDYDRVRGELAEVRDELKRERSERQESERQAREKSERNRTALERQGKALAREKSASRVMRDILITLQGHLALRETIVEQRWPEGRPEWLLPVPEGVLDPLPPVDEDDEGLHIGG